MVDERFAHDRFLVDQLVRPIANLYRITPLAAGETPAGGPVAFVRQKKLAIKEDIRFFADEQEAEELFRIDARPLWRPRPPARPAHGDRARDRARHLAEPLSSDSVPAEVCGS